MTSPLPHPPTIIVRHPARIRGSAPSCLSRVGPTSCFGPIRSSSRTRSPITFVSLLTGRNSPQQDADWDSPARWKLALGDADEPRFRGRSARSLVGIHNSLSARSKLGRTQKKGWPQSKRLYAAYRLLKRPTEGLLDQYRWAEDFLRLNRERFGD